MPEVRVEGADALAQLSRRLKAAGRKDLQKELNKSIRDALKPLRTKLPASARSTLPSKGGLNEKVADMKFSIARKNTSRESGLRLIIKDEYTISRMDDPGIVRHQVFKRKGEESRSAVWVNQRIRPGFATTPFMAERSAIQDEIEAGLARVVRSIEGSSGG